MQLKPFFRLNTLDIGLGTLFVICTVLMLKSSTDPSPSSLHGTWLQKILAPLSTGNQITFDISVGMIVSLFVYVLVVRIPEIKKRRRLKASLKRQYSLLKEDCIMNFLWACDELADLELVERLKDRTTFRMYFLEHVSENKKRWDEVFNGMDDKKLKAIVQELSLFRRDLEYTLTAIDVDDPMVFAFLRDLTRVLHRSERWSNDYNDLKNMLNFMWSMHTGWNIIKGYTDRDTIADMIDAI